MTKYRGVVMVLVVVPLSFLMETWYDLRDWVFRTFQVAPKLHHLRVQKVIDQVKRWNQEGRKKTLCTARPTWLTMSTRTATFKEVRGCVGGMGMSRANLAVRDSTV